MKGSGRAPMPAASIRRMTQSTARLQQMIMGFRTTQLLYVAATLGIADQLEAGPRSVAALAAA